MDEKKVRELKQKKIAAGFLLFLFLMAICTIVSKSVYASKLPQVTVTEAERKAIEHVVEAEGIIKQGNDIAIHTLAGLRVEKINVRVGDKIEKDTVLFELDKEDLEETIEAKKLEIAKAQYQIADLKKNEEQNSFTAETEKKRAGEDMTSAQSKADTALNRADAALSEAQNKLNKHLENGVNTTSDTDRQKAYAVYQEWVNKGKQLQDNVSKKQTEASDLGKQTADVQAKVAEAENIIISAEQKLVEIQSKLSAVEQKVTAAKIRVEEAEQNVANGGGDAAQAELDAAKKELDAVNKEMETARAEQEAAETELKAAQTGKDTCQSQLAEIQAALADTKLQLQSAEEEFKNYMANLQKEPDFSNEDSAKKAWESNKELLESNIKSAEYGKEDALTGKKEAMTDAGRTLEDAQIPAKADSTMEINKMELDHLEKELEKYREIYKKDGKVTSGVDGTVTKINLITGERTVDGAAVVCADSSLPFQFEASFTKEQKKYINQGDDVTLKPAKGSPEDLKIDYLMEEEGKAGEYRAVIYLPEGSGELGMSAALKKSEMSQLYEICIPVEALHSNSANTGYYIYLIGEREGILGSELYALKRTVKVLDKNEKYAALEAGSLTQEEEVILGADREFTENDVIRYKE